MRLRTLHDRVRNLGLGAMYEKHGQSDFRDLFDNTSADWGSTEMPQKVVDLQGFASAGVSAGELIQHYRETMVLNGTGGVLDSLPATMLAYRNAGYWPPLPGDVDASVDALPAPHP